MGLRRWEALGRLAGDPECKDVKSKGKGKTIRLAQASVTVNDFFGQGDSGENIPTFLPFEAWGAVAKKIEKSYRKGSGVFVEGRIDRDSWESNGVRKTMLKLVATHIEFSPGKPQQKEGK